jgi:hypothetical protein
MYRFKKRYGKNNYRQLEDNKPEKLKTHVCLNFSVVNG